MNILKRLFGTSSQEKSSGQEYPDKDTFKVYPRIKNCNWNALSQTYSIPLGGDLVLVFVQDIHDKIWYVTNEDMRDEAVRRQVLQWKANIKEVGFELFSPETWNNRVYFNQPGDYSNEKVFDPDFIKTACEFLKTDKLVISISRRHRMHITSYYEEYPHLEDFFYQHFSTWRNTDLEDEVLSEMVLVAEKDRLTHVVPLGFRMDLFEKADGTKVLNYSTMDDWGDKIDFQQIIENRKIGINPEVL